MLYVVRARFTIYKKCCINLYGLMLGYLCNSWRGLMLGFIGGLILCKLYDSKAQVNITMIYIIF